MSDKWERSIQVNLSESESELGQWRSLSSLLDDFLTPKEPFYLTLTISIDDKKRTFEFTSFFPVSSPVDVFLDSNLVLIGGEKITHDDLAERIKVLSEAFRLSGSGPTTILLSTGPDSSISDHLDALETLSKLGVKRFYLHKRD